MKFIKLTAYLLLLTLVGCQAEKKEDQSNNIAQPNILVITCEDISPYIGCYGDEVAMTPNIDKLASEGVRFTNMFSVAGVCAPSRNALITGMYPTSIGGNNMRTGNKREVENVPDELQIPPYECTPPAEVKCYTEYLREAGYYCTNNEKEDYQFNPPVTAWDESSRFAHWKNRPEGKPFFAIFNLMRSHESQVNVWLNEPIIIHPDSVEVPPYYPDTEDVRRDIARMHSNNTIMDREVGELLAQLEEAGLKDSTIIIFYSDHGGPLPRGKREIKDSGLNVPFIIRFPDKKYAGTVVDDLCSFVDIPPTILSLLDIQIPDYIQGQAFWGEQKAQPRKYIYAARDRMDEWFDCRRAVRDKNYKYIRNYFPEIGAYLDLDFRKQLNSMQELLKMRDEGRLNEEQMYWFRTHKAEEELYDLEKDPYELNNLADNPEYKDVLQRMRQEHLDWVERIDDKGVKYKNEKDLMLSMWPEGKQPKTQNPQFKVENGMVYINSATKGASIGYQVNGEGMNKIHWFLYAEPFEATKGDTITAIAHRIGYKPARSSFVY
jgi:arylsulfatase A-like enzyme